MRRIKKYFCRKCSYFWDRLLGLLSTWFFFKWFINKDKHTHYSLINDRIYLGATPVVSSNKEKLVPNDVKNIKQNILGTNGMVVSLLAEEDKGVRRFDPQAGQSIRTAQDRDWDEGVTYNNTVQLPDADSSFDPNAMLEQIAGLMLAMYNFLSAAPNNSMLYIHCNVGKGRSYMVLLLYLCLFDNSVNSIDDADRIIRDARPQVSRNSGRKRIVMEWLQTIPNRVELKDHLAINHERIINIYSPQPS